MSKKLWIFQGQTARANFRNRRPQGTNPKAKKGTETIACKYCGGKHKKDKQLCPAYGEICTNCQSKNHFHRVCKQRKKSDLERSTNSVNRLDNSSDSDDSLYNVEHFVELWSQQVTNGLQHLIWILNVCQHVQWLAKWIVALHAIFSVSWSIAKLHRMETPICKSPMPNFDYMMDQSTSGYWHA